MPYTSGAQRGWAHTKGEGWTLGGAAKVAEWDSASKGKKLPYHVSLQRSYSDAKRSD